MTNLSDIWRQVPIDYYQNGVKDNFLQKIWHTHKINRALNILKKLKFKNALDIGCASGYMLSEIAKKIPDRAYYGVDVYSDAIFYAKKNYPKIKFKVGHAEKLPYKNNYFDLVISYETAEHVENPTLMLKEIKRVLKKNGKLLLAMDSGVLVFRIIWFLWEHTKGKVWKNAHINPFHHDHLEKLILENGLKLEKKFFSHAGLEVIFILSK